MRDSYYNEYEFSYANNIMHINPYESRARFEDYLLKYPNDYSARAYYSYVLILLGKLSEAQEVIEKLENDAFYDKKFNNKNMQKKFSIFMEKITLAKIRLLFYQGKYQELYDNFFKDSSVLNPEFDIDYSDVIVDRFNYNTVLFYCKKKLGLLKPDLKAQSYLYNQILEYSDDRFFEHIQKHIAEDSMVPDTSYISIFKCDFKLNEMINEVKKYIPSENALYFGLLQDVYIFKYNNCGWSNNQITNYFEVVCFHDTCEFFTMHPVGNSEHFPFVDLNYINDILLEIDCPKIKRRSQVDKFNKKFNIK